MAADLNYETCVVGAGPYGLAIGAHLRAKGVNNRVFGKVLERWRHQMPKAMLLKSEGFGSSISEPGHQFTLARYCEKEGRPYEDRGLPVSREVFVDYAMSFQRQYVPQVEEKMVDAVEQTSDGFRVTLENGERVRTPKLVIAVGMHPRLPKELEQLPSNLWSHTVAHYDLSKFKGKVVAIIGAGQSALETAVLLLDEGASPIVIAKNAPLVWNTVPNLELSWFDRIRRPLTPLCQGPGCWFFYNYPNLFHLLPLSTRVKLLERVLGSAGAWWLKERFLREVPVRFGSIIEAAPQEGGVIIKFSAEEGRTNELTADHVIAGTGYLFDIDSLKFLDPALKSAIGMEMLSPTLSADFESSVPGLYFAGLASALSQGPSMRFMCGTGYAAERISNHIARSLKGRSIPYQARHESEAASAKL